MNCLRPVVQSVHRAPYNGTNRLRPMSKPLTSISLSTPTVDKHTINQESPMFHVNCDIPASEEEIQKRKQMCIEELAITRLQSKVSGKPFLKLEGPILMVSQ